MLLRALISLASTRLSSVALNAALYTRSSCVMCEALMLQPAKMENFSSQELMRNILLNNEKNGRVSIRLTLFDTNKWSENCHKLYGRYGQVPKSVTISWISSRPSLP